MMTSPLILDIPEADEDRAAWLEKQLVSSRLPELVTQLAAFNEMAEQHDNTATTTFSLEEFVNRHGTAVYQKGLQTLSIDDAHSLLQNPESLLELQQLVFANGGKYWDSIIQTNQIVASPIEDRAADKDKAKVSPVPMPASDTNSKTWLWAGLAVAAALLIVVGLQLFSADNGFSSGLASTEILQSKGTAPDYFLAIADAGENWNEHTFGDREELLEGLSALSTSCERLIDAPHRPLNTDQSKWLVAKCTDWKGKIDGVRDRLVANEIDFAKASEETSEIVEKLVSALREKGELS